MYNLPLKFLRNVLTYFVRTIKAFTIQPLHKQHKPFSQHLNLMIFINYLMYSRSLLGYQKTTQSRIKRDKIFNFTQNISYETVFITPLFLRSPNLLESLFGVSITTIIFYCEADWDQTLISSSLAYVA